MMQLNFEMMPHVLNYIEVWALYWPDQSAYSVPCQEVCCKFSCMTGSIVLDKFVVPRQLTASEWQEMLGQHAAVGASSHRT